MNSLANHHILPHNGKGITKEMAIKALTSSVKFDSFISTTFTLGALLSNPDHRSHMFDLDMVDKHGLIEHDVSLSRDDFALGDNHTFNKEIFETVLSTYGDAKETSFETASKARWERLMACKKAHEDAGKPFVYGIREFICSYGETALFTSVLGDKKAGTCPIEYLRIFFGEFILVYSSISPKLTDLLNLIQVWHLIFYLYNFLKKLRSHCNTHRISLTT